jgi:hypothetical protein
MGLTQYRHLGTPVHYARIHSERICILPAARCSGCQLLAQEEGRRRLIGLGASRGHPSLK